MSQSAAAPEKMRMKVKLAASMPECFKAARQSKELPAKAIIASSVRRKRRVGFTVCAALSGGLQLAGFAFARRRLFTSAFVAFSRIIPHALSTVRVTPAMSRNIQIGCSRIRNPSQMT